MFPFLILKLNFVGYFFAEKTGWHKHQYDDEKNKSKGIAEGCPADTLDDVFADTDYEGSDYGTRYGTDSTEYCRNKGL